MTSPELESRQVLSRKEHFRFRSEYVIAEYLRDQTIDQRSQRLREKLSDRSLSQEDAYEIIREANIDEKTDIDNSKFLKYILNYEMAQARQFEQPVSLLVFDIDDFKTINTELGHTGADDVLREVAQAMHASVRTSDEVTPIEQDQAVSRWGGEEFVVVLPGANQAQARLVAERIRTKVEQSFLDERPNGQPVTVTVGIAEYDRSKHGDAASDDQATNDKQKSWRRFIQEADQAMLEGKQTEKNRVYPAAV